VTLDGQPVETGSIAFRPKGQTKGPSAGGTIQDGAYSIDRAQGPVVGTMRVEINATRKTGRPGPEGLRPSATPFSEMI